LTRFPIGSLDILVDRSPGLLRQFKSDDPIRTLAAQDFRGAKPLFVPLLKRDIVQSIAWAWPPREGHMAIHIRRRELIGTLGGAAVVWPLAARAQQATVPVIGFLSAGSAQSYANRVTAFRQGLSEAGLVEGRNFTIEYRWADGQYSRLPVLATELVHRQVAVIATGGASATLAAKAATTTIPIVFETSANPVKLGVAASLNRPGGNITGVSQAGSAEEIASKRVELLHELVPKAGVLALLVNPTAPELAEPQTREVVSAAQSFGIDLHTLNASTEHDFDRVFARLTELRAGGLVIAGDSLFSSRAKQLAALTVRHAVPAIYQIREFAEAGGLISYGSNIAETHRLMGVYAGRILKGDRPADLPLQQATKVEMYINLKTARALGINIPLPLSGRADEIFE
jgi:putative ABC transport system substrate-binding protein